MKAAEWSATLQALAADHWLEIDGQARVFLGLRAHAELRDVLRESDVPVCPTCNEPVVKGEQKEVAGGSVVKVHLHCLRVAAASDGSGASSSSAAVKSAAAQMTLLKHAYGDWKYKHGEWAPPPCYCCVLPSVPRASGASLARCQSLTSTLTILPALQSLPLFCSRSGRCEHSVRGGAGQGAGAEQATGDHTRGRAHRGACAWGRRRGRRRG